jgi:hypothetical protein
MANKHNNIIFPIFPQNGEMNISNALVTTGVWNEVDLSGFVGSKIAKVLLHFEVLGGYDDLTEYITCRVRPKGATNVQDKQVGTIYGGLIGEVECWTDEEGKIEWCSMYEQNYLPPDHNNTIILQIKIVASLD